jgi:hypothetical protein
MRPKSGIGGSFPGVALLLLGCAGGADVGSVSSAPPPSAPAIQVEKPTPPAAPSRDWTELATSADARIVYVSSSTGSEANDGLSEAKPKKRLASGKAQLRNGYPDRLLLKRGDAWDEDFGDGWELSGRSEKERMVIGAYGSGERPTLRTGNRNGFSAWHDKKHDHLAIVGLRFTANGYDGKNGSPRGIAFFGKSEDLLLEDCSVEGYETNLVFQGAPEGVGRHRNVAIRRCVVVDAYSKGDANCAGLFVSSTDGLLVEECLFDRNGWRDDVPGTQPNWFRRNVYVQSTNTDVVVRGNIVARTDGMQVRPGGTVEQNLLLKNAIGILVGGGDPPVTGGVVGVVRWNVILDGNDLQAGQARGWGMNFENVREAKVEANVIAHNESGHFPYSFTFGVDQNGKGSSDVLLSSNVVYDWRGPLRFFAPSAEIRNVRLAMNRFQEPTSKEPLVDHTHPPVEGSVRSSGNAFFSTKPAKEWVRIGESSTSLESWRGKVGDASSEAKKVEFPDPARTIATYHASIGGAPTLEAFLAEARKQSRENWREAYTAAAVNRYVRAGFGLE